MLTAPKPAPAPAAAARTDDDDAWFTAWRSRELSRVDRAGITYLDYTGAALYPESLVARDAARLGDTVLGNPHSVSAPSQNATHDVAAARAAILDFLDADPAEYTVVLTMNASGACKLVAESFPFTAGSVFAQTRDNHNSINGIREYARAGGATVRLLPIDDELRLSGAETWFGTPVSAPSLFAYPAQSNFSGVRHSLDLVARARRAGWRTFLDAAAYLPTHDLDLREVKPDFLCLSMYKFARYPGGIGALVARHEALAELRRPAFAGGTVDWVSIEHQRHRLTRGSEGFEDGTVAFLGAGAVAPALAAARDAGRERLARHLRQLAGELLEAMVSARHANGAPRFAIHGPANTRDRGATVAFSVLDANGGPVPFWTVEELAMARGIAVRSGCFCNPGCSERAFRFDEGPVSECLDSLGDDFTIPKFAECMGGRTVGAVRVSLGLGTVRADVRKFIDFVHGLS